MRSTPLLFAGLGLVAFGLAACDGGDEPLPATTSSTPTTEGPLPGPEEWNREVTPPTDAEAAEKRAACDYKAGSLPAETHGASTPSGKDIPVEHVLVLMMENRSFDHYFQKLPEYGQPDVEVAPADFSNPDNEGNPVPIFHDETHCFVDTNHGWAGVHAQVNGGKMDGFFLTNDGQHEVPVDATLDMISGKRALGYYDETDLPFYYWLASEFSIADHYHSSMLGPTFPNRMFLYAASSFGFTYNSLPEADTILVDQLEKREVDWKVYATGTPGLGLFFNQFLEYEDEHVRSIDDYFADAAAGTLPQFAFIDPNVGREGPLSNDEHPPSLAMIGERFAAEVVDALTKSPNWKDSALFLTYDEHGGLYDHVVPPKAASPRRSPREDRARRPGGRLRPARHPRAPDCGLPVCEEALREPQDLRPHLHRPLHRGEVRDARALRPRRQRRGPVGDVRLRLSASRRPARGHPPRARPGEDGRMSGHLPPLMPRGVVAALACSVTLASCADAPAPAPTASPASASALSSISATPAPSTETPRRRRRARRLRAYPARRGGGGPPRARRSPGRPRPGHPCSPGLSPRRRPAGSSSSGSAASWRRPSSEGA